MNEVLQTIEAQAGTALAVIPASAVSTIIAADHNDILGKLAAKVQAFRGDVSTSKGRKEIASLAAEIASSKMDLIRIGKGLTDDWRKSTAAVNAECKIIEERMDALKVQVRQPLTDYENIEKVRVKGHEDALAAIQESPAFYAGENSSEDFALRLQWLRDHPNRDWQEFAARAAQVIGAEFTLAENALAAALKREADRAELARLREIEAQHQREAAARAQVEREARIAAEAADQARAAAEHAARAANEAVERKAAADRLAAEQAQARADKAERDRAEDARRAEQARVAAVAQAERDAVAAVEVERARVAREQAAADAAAAKRTANLEHRKRINGDALECLIALGLTEEQGKAVVIALALGKIKHATIAY